MVYLRRFAWGSPVVIGLVLTSHGQKKPAPPAPSALLLVNTDDACRLALDGAEQGVITPDQSKKINVPLRELLLKCVIEAAPDSMRGKAIEIKASDQAVAIVTLNGLHIQYDQAMGQRNQAVAAQVKRQTRKPCTSGLSNGIT